MSLLAAIASGGIWPALPWTGYWLFARAGQTAERLGIPLLPKLALMTVAGMAVWSVALLGSAMMGVYRPEVFGAAGWVVTLASVAMWLPNAKTVLAQGWHRMSGWDGVLAVGLAVAAGFYIRYPTDTIACGDDETVYANHGVYLAEHGRLDVPYPWRNDLDPAFREAFKRQLAVPGLYVTEPTMTVQFAHLFPLWLAQAFATLGPVGLFRLNAGLALLSLSVFYGLGCLLLPRLATVAATLFLAFNPSQLWLARISLSEMLTQLWIWSGLLLFYQALNESNRLWARWAGVFLGMAAVVRCDSLLLVPLLFLAHLGMVLIQEPTTERTGAVWAALYQTALPVFLFAVAYYRFYSTCYFTDLHEQLTAIGWFVVISLGLLLGVSRAARFVRPWFRSPWVLAVVGLGLIVVMVYGYWLRPRWNPTAIQSWTLAHLERYLSSLVIWAAFGGCLLALAALPRQSRNVHLLPMLVVGLAFSGLYLWQPSVHPYHFWAVRRYVPVVMPAFVMFAALALTWALRRLPAWAALATTILVIAWLSHFTVQAGRLIWFFPENYGLYRSIRSLDDHLPQGDLVVAHGTPSRLVPFPFAFGRLVVVLNAWDEKSKVHNYEKAAGLLERWLTTRLGQEQPVYLLCENYRFPGRHNHEVHQETCWRDSTKQVWMPLPKETEMECWTWYLYRITALPTPSDYINLSLGNERVWGVEESGFGDPTQADGQPIRSIKDKGRLVVPLDRSSPPQALTVSLKAGRSPTNLRVLANGQELFQGTVSSDDWSQRFDLTGIRFGKRLTIEIVCDALSPKGAIERDKGETPVGVMVKAIRLLREEPPQTAAPNAKRK
jgi:hypothetical protein